MNENLDDIRIVSARRVRTKKFTEKKATPVLQGTEKKEIIRNGNEPETEVTIPFEKWTLPPQPEGYIQYLPFDLY